AQAVAFTVGGGCDAVCLPGVQPQVRATPAAVVTEKAGGVLVQDAIMTETVDLAIPHVSVPLPARLFCAMTLVDCEVDPQQTRLARSEVRRQESCGYRRGATPLDARGRRCVID